MRVNVYVLCCGFVALRLLSLSANLPCYHVTGKSAVAYSVVAW